MRFEGKSTRLRKRESLGLPLKVRYRVNSELEWTEEAETTTVSEIGAGFEITSPVERARLIYLELPMPRTLRFYDQRAEHYGIWAVVRYILTVKSDDPDRIRFATGVAFIGKTPPNSYIDDPTMRYDLTPTLTKNGWWGVREIPRNIGRYARQDETRHEIKTGIIIEIIDERGNITARDSEAETRNISSGGAAITTSLSTEIGKFVRITSISHNVSLIAVVRGQQRTADVSYLNLQFLSGKWILTSTA